MNDRLIDNPQTPSNKFSVVKCVVCNSFGSLSYGRKICHACKGKGYIVINNKTGMSVESKK